MKKTAASDRPDCMPPPGLTSAEYRVWLDQQTDEAIAADDAGEQTFTHQQVREEILKRRLARVRSKSAA